MREIEIKGHTYSESEEYPMWQVIKRLPEYDDSISITLIMAKTHKEAVKEAENTGPEGIVVYVTSVFNLFQRLEFMINEDTG